MPSLANLLENYRNWKGRQDWQSGKEMQDYFGGDPVAQEQFDRLSGFGTADLGGLSGMAGAIKASHGSPHAFEKFDFSKIGTGEGAQAYGHGGYFGQGFDSPVAKKYAEELANIDQNTGYSTAHLNAQHQVKRFGNDPEWAAEVVSGTMRNFDPKDPQYASLADTLKLIQSGDYAKPLATEGNLYNVELKWPDAAKEAADPLGEHHLLDWDAPYEQQPQNIQDLFAQTHESVVNKRTGIRESLRQKFAAQGKVAPIREQMSPITGQQLYDQIASELNSRKLASKYIDQQGIPGIRYLDQGSRSAGTGSSNYVMFDDRFPEIVSRNGVSLSDLLRR